MTHFQNRQSAVAVTKRSTVVDHPTNEQLKQLEADLWSAADNLRANSDLKSSEYATPVLGLIFLKFADDNYRRHEADIIAEYQKLKGARRERKLSDIAIEKCGFYLPDHARYGYLLDLPEEKNIAKALKEAMKAIEEYKPELEGVLPKDEYFRLTRDEKTKNIPNQLLKTFANIPADFSGDLFGQIYEYFLAEFARSEGSKGGEFFTPRSVVRLMVEMIEPHGGKVFDPACGSGGMFVQSAQFIAQHRKEIKNGDSDVFVYGQEKTLETVNLAKMNLAVNGLRGEVKKANTYYDDPHGSLGTFDYVLANPPFNVDDVSLSSVEKDIVSSSGVSSYHDKWKVKGPGVIIGRKGTLGTVHFIRSHFWPHDTTLWVKDFKGNDPRFLSYFLKTLKLENLDVGASNPTLNRNHIHKLRIIFPKKVETQKRIGAILSAYDDLVESNQKRITLLERLAEDIYREWFVRFRFSGYQKAKFVKGIPFGWEVKRLGELVRTQYGYTASAETEGDGPKFLRITDIVPPAIDWENVPHCKIDERDEEKYLLREGDIVVARTGATVGYAKRINKHHPKTVFASYLVRLIPQAEE